MSGNQVNIIEISTITRIFINRVNVIVRRIFAHEENPVDIDFVNKIFNTFDYSFINEPVKRNSKSKSEETEIVKKPKSKKPKQRFFNITSECKQAILWIMNDIALFCNKDDNESHKNVMANIQTEIDLFTESKNSYLSQMSSFAVGLPYWIISNKKDKKIDGNKKDDDDDDDDGDDDDDDDDDDDGESRIKKLYTREKTNEMLYNAFHSGYNKLGITNPSTKDLFARYTTKLFEYFINLVARQTAQNNLRNRRFVLSEQLFENMLTIVFKSSMLTLKLSNYMNTKPKKAVQPRKKKQSKLEQAVTLLEQTLYNDEEQRKSDKDDNTAESDEIDDTDEVREANGGDDEVNNTDEVREANGEDDEVNNTDEVREANGGDGEVNANDDEFGEADVNDENSEIGGDGEVGESEVDESDE